MRQTPIATSLTGILEACERQITNCSLMFQDCYDNEDCDHSYLQQLAWTQKNWMELATDVRAMIENEADKHLLGTEGPRPTP